MALKRDRLHDRLILLAQFGREQIHGKNISADRAYSTPAHKTLVKSYPCSLRFDMRFSRRASDLSIQLEKDTAPPLPLPRPGSRCHCARAASNLLRLRARMLSAKSRFPLGNRPNELCSPAPRAADSTRPWCRCSTPSYPRSLQASGRPSCPSPRRHCSPRCICCAHLK